MTLASDIVRSCCETDPADPDSSDTILISVKDLESVLQSHVEPLLDTLREARRLDNQTVRDMGEHAAWRRTVDALLPEDPSSHYDAPHRIEHRQRVNSLFKSGRF